MYTKKIKYTTFDGSYSVESIYSEPDRYAQIDLISGSNKNLIPRGGGFSYSALSFDKKSISISTKHLNRFLEFDPKRKIIKVESGVKLIDLINFLHKKGFYLPVIPGHPLITIGACIAADVHGKNPFYDGTFCDWVNAIELYHPIKGYLKLKNNSKIFSLTCGGFGMTGLIINTSLKIKPLKSNFIETNIKKTNTIYDLINALVKSKSDYSYTWSNLSNLKKHETGLLFESSWVLKKLPVHATKFNDFKGYNFNYNTRKLLPFSLFNKFTIFLFNKFYFFYALTFKRNFKIHHIKSNFPFGFFSIYHFFYGRQGFYEPQFLVSFQNSFLFIQTVLHIIKKSKVSACFMSLKKFNGRQESLSMTGKGILVSFNFKRTKDLDLFLLKLKPILIKFKVQPNLTKDSKIDYIQAKNTIKNYKKFKAAINTYDSKRVFKSYLSNKIRL